ncbi:hypothetical protein Pcinc_020596 [Petrolisthes cinctipes]|nr:hypothetical protein Pcinc_033174 [Petrolisthes cinctipes]KAK3874467.1 hypothetical protein Pcinc_020596 [Petrolisthes cinctipes]
MFWKKGAVLNYPKPGHTSPDLNDEFQEIFDQELSEDFPIWQPEIINRKNCGIPEVESVKYNADSRLELGVGISAVVYALNPRYWPNHPPLCIKVFTITPRLTALTIAMKEARTLTMLA